MFAVRKLGGLSFGALLGFAGLGLLGLGAAGCSATVPAPQPEEVSFSLFTGDAKVDASSARALRGRIRNRPRLEAGRWFDGELRAMNDNRGELVIDGGLFEIPTQQGVRVDLVSTSSTSGGQPGVGLALFARAIGEHDWRAVEALSFTRGHGDTVLYNVYDSVELDGAHLTATAPGVEQSATRNLESATLEYGLFPVIAELALDSSVRAPYAMQLNDIL